MDDLLQRFLRTALELPPDRLPKALGELEEVRSTLWARLTAPAPVQSPGYDERITIGEAARRLGLTEDYIYHHHGDFSFTRREGRKLLFSASGIEASINQKNGFADRRKFVTTEQPAIIARRRTSDDSNSRI